MTGYAPGKMTLSASPRTLAPAAWVAAGALALAFLTIFFALPVANLIGLGFIDDGALDLGGFSSVFSRSRTWRIIGLTLGQAAAGTVLSVVLGIPAAYVLYRRAFPGQGIVRAIITVPFVLPTVVVGVAFRSLLSESGPLGFLGLDGTVTAIVIALVFFNYALVIRGVGGMWERLDPRAEEAAAALGASPARVFLTVTLPALGPAIASAASLVFLFSATAFGVVLVLGGPRVGTVETEIWILTTQFLDLRSASVLSIVQLIIVVGVLLGANAARNRREVALSLTSTEVPRKRLNLRTDFFPVLITAIVGIGLLLAPMAYLVLASLRTSSGWGLGNYRALGTLGTHNALSVNVWQAAANSLKTALLATLIAVTVGVIVSLISSRRPASRTGRALVAGLDSAFMLPLGVSAVTVGFGFLITLNRPPLDLRSSMILIPIAQAVVAIPLVVRTITPVLRAINPRMREVASTLGAGPGAVLRTIDGPFLLRSLGLAIGFAFAASLGEFGATSFLARPEAPTLPKVIFRLISRPGPDNSGLALAASEILATVTATIMGVSERLRGESSREF